MEKHLLKQKALFSTSHYKDLIYMSNPLTFTLTYATYLIALRVKLRYISQIDFWQISPNTKGFIMYNVGFCRRWICKIIIFLDKHNVTGNNKVHSTWSHFVKRKKSNIIEFVFLENMYSLKYLNIFQVKEWRYFQDRLLSLETWPLLTLLGKIKWNPK